MCTCTCTGYIATIFIAYGESIKNELNGCAQIKADSSRKYCWWESLYNVTNCVYFHKSYECKTDILLCYMHHKHMPDGAVRHSRNHFSVCAYTVLASCSWRVSTVWNVKCVSKSCTCKVFPHVVYTRLCCHALWHASAHYQSVQNQSTRVI